MNDSTPTHQPEASELLPCPMDRWVAYAKRGGLLDENGIAPDRMKAQTAFYAFSEAWNESHRAVVAALATQPPSAPAQVGTSGAPAEFAMREVLSELVAIDTAVEHWIKDKRPRSILLKAITENIRSLLAAMSSPAAKVGTEDADAQARWGDARAVGNAIAQLKTFDPATPFFGAFHLEGHAVARGVTFSREKVVGERWIGERYEAGKWVSVPRDAVPYSVVVWSMPEIAVPQPPEALAPAAPVAAVGEAVPLTHEQIDTINEQVYRVWAREMPSQPLRHSFARAVEAAHGILPAASMGAK